MSCSDVLDLIEPIAAGELGADEAVRAHLQSCVTCAAALASAQRLESALKGMEIPPAPATFAATVMQRIRRDRWQSEQNVDRLFNLAIVAAVLLMIGGVAAMLNIDGLLVCSCLTGLNVRDYKPRGRTMRRRRGASCRACNSQPRLDGAMREKGLLSWRH